MNILAIFTLFQSVLSVPLLLNSTFMTEYNNYIKEYQKDFSYDHFSTFKKNRMVIDEINNGNESYTLEINQFADNDGLHSKIYKPKNDHQEYYELTKNSKKINYQNLKLFSLIRNQILDREKILLLSVIEEFLKNKQKLEDVFHEPDKLRLFKSINYSSRIDAMLS